MLKFFAIAVIIYLCEGGTSLSSKRTSCPEGGGDISSDCGYWKTSGYCEQGNDFFDYMQDNCPVTCGFCQVILPVCPESDPSSDCGYWKTLGYCEPGNDYYDYMQDKCPVTCGFCEALPTPAPVEAPTDAPVEGVVTVPVCPEEVGDISSADCGYWKTLGYCESENDFFDYMKDNCPATCGFCEALPTPAPVDVPAAAPTYAPVEGVVTVNIEECLEAHNSKRGDHGAEPLTWDASLATKAQEWAYYLASNDVFEHAPFTGAGENLLQDPNTDGKLLTCKEAVEAWYAEVANYPFQNPPNSISDYNPLGQIGHFTQIVWKSTSEVGVGIAASSTYTYIVARYTPPGNYEGQFQQQVGYSIWARK